MALNMQDMMPTFHALNPAKLDSGGATSLQRQQMKLALDQFEEVKRQNAESNRLREMAEAGERTRAGLVAERARQQAAALIAAEELKAKTAAQVEVMKQRRDAYGDMLKRPDTGNYEGMELDASRINELGGSAERLGQDAHGMPSWRVDLDPEKTRQEEQAQTERVAPGEVDNPENPYSTHPGDESLPASLDRLGGVGYQTLGTRDPLTEGPGIASSGDMTPEQMARVTGGGTAQRAATDQALAAETGPLAVAPDMGPPAADADTDPSPIKPEFQQAVSALDPLGAMRPRSLAPAPAAAPDIMGGVPKNVIDTGAINAQAQSRLGPIMASIERSMPSAYRDSTRANDQAAAAMGLPVDKAVAQSLALRAPADAAIARELGAERDLGKEEREAERKRQAADAKAIAAAKPTPEGEQKLFEHGQKQAKATFGTSNIKANLDVLESSDEIAALLDDDFPENDAYAVNFLMHAGKNVGAQSDKDAARFEGLESASTLEQVQAWIFKKQEGGTYAQMKDSMKEFASQVKTRAQANVFDWMGETQKSAYGAGHPRVQAGYESILHSLPHRVLDAYEKEHPYEEEPAAAGGAPARQPTSGVDGEEGGDDGNDDEEAEPPGDGRIPKTSRIAYTHNNPGNLMFADQKGAEQGEEKEGGGHWAKFKSVDDGLSALRDQVQHDAKAGASIATFITKYAPPTDGNDTEKYISDAVRELKAESGDDALSDVDPDDVVRFVAKKESSTTVAPAPKKAAAGRKGSDDHKLLEGL